MNDTPNRQNAERKAAFPGVTGKVLLTAILNFALIPGSTCQFEKSALSFSEATSDSGDAGAAETISWSILLQSLFSPR